MRIGKLTIGYDRGLTRNDEKDLETEKHRGSVLADGGILRGLGTKFKSARDQELVKLRDQHAAKIRQAFREKFVATSIDGVYVLTEVGAGKRFAADLNTRELQELEITVRLQEFDLVTEDLDTGELRAWSERIKNQLASVQLGRKKEIDEEGLDALITLSQAPIISKETGRRIRELVEALRENKITRLDIKRSLADLDVEIDQGAIIAPRRPSMAGAL